MNRTWLYVAILVLATVALALFVRPCELYRTRVVLQHAEFGWQNTSCAPMKVKDGCYCATPGLDPWVIGEWADEPQKALDPEQEVMPRIEF